MKTMIKDVYFRHDASASEDSKIMMLETDYNESGYTWYFKILEILRLETTHRIKKNDYMYPFLFKKLKIQPEKELTFKNFLNDCIHKHKLFKEDSKSFWSSRMSSFMKKVKKISEGQSKKAKKRHEDEKNKKSGKYYNNKKGKGYAPAYQVHKSRITDV